MFAVRRLILSMLWVASRVMEEHVSKGTVFDMESSIDSYRPKYNFYHNLSSLNDCIHSFSGSYPDFVDVEMKYRSRWGLSQYLIRVTNFTRFQEKSFVDDRAKILFSFGEHSSEFLPVESMLFLLENITSGTQLGADTSAKAFSEFALNNIDLYIVAILNPDGRFIIEKTNNYCWKYTSTKLDVNSLHGDASFVERNAILHQGEPNRVTSEPECKVIAELLAEKKIDILMSFHSGGRYIIVPDYNNLDATNTRKNHRHYPNLNDHVYLASLLSAETPLRFPHTIINVSSVNKESILLYAAKSKKIPFSYIISLWGSDEHSTQQKCFDASNPQSEQLQEALEAIHPLYNVIFNYAVEWKWIQHSLKTTEAIPSSAKGRGWRILSIQSLVVVVVLYIIYILSKKHLPFRLRILLRRPRRIVSLRSLATAFSFLLLTV